MSGLDTTVEPKCSRKFIGSLAQLFNGLEHFGGNIGGDGGEIFFANELLFAD